ncbi:tetratricopeptide repeat protein [Spirosoma agri]|uniref:histidine kinase n=1 Tax=Spirosoma agri TaxID=1987381 RepID=A0A6M0IPX3_9BACT|nr:tetratricopeptide repeat protein [Spirosoma agri]NEU69992.1 tetratricopeptide repeat protein [Spirosoma agri]
MREKYIRWLLAILTLLPVRSIAQGALPVTVSDTLKAWVLRERGDSLVEAGQFIDARQAYQQSLTLAQRIDNAKEIGLGYRSIGYWYESTGDYNKAINYYQQALEIFRSNPNQRHYVRTLSFVGFCYDRLNDRKLALQYINDAMAIAKRKGYRDLEMQGYGDLANLEANRKEFGQALAHQQMILSYYKQQKDWTAYYTALYNAALLYKNMGQYVQSEKAFDQVLAFANQPNGDPYLAGYAYVSFPYALIPQHKLDQAETCCRRALAWVEQTGTAKHSLLDEINGHLSRIWEERGDFRKALFYYKQQVFNHDSVFNATKSRQVVELEARFQNREKELEIQRLAEANTDQTYRTWLAVGGIGLLVVLLGTLFVYYRRAHHSTQKIQQQSERISLMLKEMHHRIKNNLAIISGLLFLQTTRGNNDELVQAMKTGQQRVEAMSLIHQRLYQSDQTTTIDMREYVDDLIHNLLKAYGYQTGQFNLQMDVEFVDLDIDVALPLGLIINELATNALKYAYATIQQPALRICLCSNPNPLRKGIILEVQDNGPGIDEREWQQLSHQHSFGKRLITLLSQQLEGTYEISKRDGTLFRLQIPVARLSA